ncbi:MAG: 50S ribosomal protein L4, partial [Dehalococcoidales bacterium]
KIMESLKLDEIKTKNVAGILDALEVDNTTLVVTGESNVNLVKSARNLPGVNTLPANLLNVVDIISHRTLLMEIDAVRKAEQLWGENSSGEENDATA